MDHIIYSIYYIGIYIIKAIWEKVKNKNCITDNSIMHGISDIFCYDYDTCKLEFVENLYEEIIFCHV